MSDAVLDFEEEPCDDIESWYTGDFIHVEDVINKVATYKGYRIDRTSNGERMLIAVEVDGMQTAFFTGSVELRRTLEKREQSLYPFRAVIKVVQHGTFLGFKFFSPTSEITTDDINLFNRYKRNKFKK